MLFAVTIVGNKKKTFACLAPLDLAKRPQEGGFGFAAAGRSDGQDMIPGQRHKHTGLRCTR